MLKREFLELLEKDKEFRYAVAGLLGYREILDELRKLREDFNKLYQKSLEHDKRFEILEKKLLEHDRRFEAIERKLLEHDKRFEAIERKLLEHDKRFEEMNRRFEEIEKRLEEHSKRIEELVKVVAEHGKVIEKLAAQITALGNRYGIYTDEALRDALKYVIEDLLKVCRVERWIYYDSEGIVYGAPSVVEIDACIHNDQHVLIEYKASIDRSDVLELHRVGQLYEKVRGVKPRLLMVSPSIRRRAKELAKALGIEVRGVVVEM